MTDRTAGDGLSRRRLLAAGGALSGALVAGCLGAGDSDDETPDDGESTTGGAETAPYRAWLYRPATLVNRDRYSFRYLAFDAFVDARDDLSEGTYDGFRRDFSSTPLLSLVELGVEDVDDYLRLDATDNEIALGEFDAEAIAERVAAVDGYERAGTAAGFEVFTPDEEGSAAAVGVSDGALVRILARDPLDGVAAVAGTPEGETPTYHEADDDMAELLDRLGGGDQTFGGTAERQEETDVDRGVLEGQVGFGYAMSFAGDRIEATYVVPHASADLVDLGAVDEWIAANDGEDQRFAQFPTVETSAEGRSAVIDAEMPADAL